MKVICSIKWIAELDCLVGKSGIIVFGLGLLAGTAEHLTRTTMHFYVTTGFFYYRPTTTESVSSDIQTNRIDKMGMLAAMMFCLRLQIVLHSSSLVASVFDSSSLIASQQ